MPYDTEPIDVQHSLLASLELSGEDAVRIEQVMHALPDLWQAYQRRLLKQQHFKGVTSGQIRLLNAMLHNAPCSVGTVATALSISMGAASESVDKLVELGYITREHSRVDRRQVILDLTDDAREIAATVRRIRIAQIAQVFARMTAAERDGFIRGLHLYRDVLADFPLDRDESLATVAALTTVDVPGDHEMIP
ncbi:MAG: hypothetical protein AVDCRST_MAG33-385 [uncultured Thermomicrobiales bacterium]|uniref:HTH marR-type domain-containing protein n=1 Tax=uncultured Thermomicrobiales bacterium TaxID=1645740 RepID=A0A6J4UD31_9BACT|nr:MAG: hypothetical protein AVDCRST_MAG33-385 [uncultured Thermomicrobiales bacterium]